MPRIEKDNLEPEEYAVYADVIHERFDERILEPLDLVIAIEASTSPVGGRPTKFNLRETAETLSNMPNLSPETLDDFLMKNQRVHKIRMLLNLRFKYVLVSTRTINEIFRDREGWDRFYQKYNSPGLIKFSRVGFNRAKDQALLYFGNQQHWLVGSGSCDLLKKENDVWRVQASAMCYKS